MIKNNMKTKADKNKISEYIKKETKEQTDRLCELYFNKYVGELDFSDIFYLMTKQTYQNKKISIATNLTQDSKIEGLYWDELGMPYMTESYTDDSITFTYTNNILIWRNKFMVGENLITNTKPRFIKWKPKRYGGMRFSLDSTNDKIYVDNPVYLTFVDYIVNIYTTNRTFNNNACRLLELDVNKNIYTHISNLFICNTNTWYQTLTTTDYSYDSMLYDEEHKKFWYADESKILPSEYHIYIYSDISSSTILNNVVNRQVYKSKIKARYFYLHNYLLSRIYNKYLMLDFSTDTPVKGSDFPLLKYVVDNCTKIESSCLSVSNNINGDNLYPILFEEFAPIKINQSWLNSTVSTFSQNTNLLKFLDLTDISKISSYRCFYNNDLQNSTINFTKLISITSDNIKTNAESFAGVKNGTIVFDNLSFMLQTNGFNRANNLNLIFNRNLSTVVVTTSGFYNDTFKYANNINFISNTDSETFKKQMATGEFFKAHDITFNKPLEILSVIGEGGVFDNYYTNTVKKEVIRFKGINLPYVDRMFKKTKNTTFIIDGDVCLASNSFMGSQNCKLEYSGNLYLTSSQSRVSSVKTLGYNFKDCKTIRYLPRLVSFEGTNEFEGSDLYVIDCSKVDLDFKFPENFTQGATNLKIVHLPNRSLTYPPTLPDNIITTHFYNRPYGVIPLSFDVGGIYPSGFFSYCIFDKNVITRYKIEADTYSFIGCTGTLYTGSNKLSDLIFKDDWNFDGNLKIIEGYPPN